MPDATIHHGDCLDVLAGMPDNSVDAIVTDPPYGLGFMGKAWDDLPPGLPWAQECLRVLKPGGHLLAFGGTRTWHRLAVAVEDAGFEVRDSIAWLYGSGFPKSLDVSKAIDKAAGVERDVLGVVTRTPSSGRGGTVHQEGGDKSGVSPITAPATPAAQQWAGWGTALKPAFEPIVVARKPLVGTVAANVLAHGTGALNIDGTRVGNEVRFNPLGTPGANSYRLDGGDGRDKDNARSYDAANRGAVRAPVTGRWPTNVVLDDHAAAELDEQSGTLKSGVLASHHARAPKGVGILGAYGSAEGERGYGDTGGASRFFPTFRYQAKAPTRERPVVVHEDGTKTAHPTVKPLELMRWLVRLVTPAGGTVLDTFAGSGTTVEAALLEGFDVIGIERDADYLPLIQARIDRATAPAPAAGPAVPTLFDDGEAAA